MTEPRSFGKNIWTLDGPNVRDMGIWFTTRMTVIKLSDGSLWVESPVPVPSRALDRIQKFGLPRYLVAATPRHVWRLKEWHKLFPQAQLWAPKASPFTLKKENLPFTGILGEVSAPWSDDLDQLAFKGNPLIEEILFYHRKSRTVILGDLIQIHSLAKGKFFHNTLLKFLGVASPLGGVGLDVRLTFIHRKLARQSLEKLISWDFDKLIIAHGACIEKDAKSFVKRAFRWLVR